MIADVCFHNDVMKDGNRQPIRHVMLTLREVNEEDLVQRYAAGMIKTPAPLARILGKQRQPHHLAL